MQSETADFGPVPSPSELVQATLSDVRLVPPGDLDETRVVFESGQFAALCENVASSTKPEMHNMLPFLSEEHRAMATCNTKSTGEILTCSFLT